MKLNGTWLDVIVDVASLREALGLPSHDTFSEGTLHECRHNDIVGQDVADTDHGARALENVENQSEDDSNGGTSS